MKHLILGDRYELLDQIGEGGMSLVYKAHCRSLDRIVAIKILKEEFSKDQVFVQSFKTEALAAAKLSHPNIVNIFDVGQDDDIHYIVMEYIEGQTLKDLISKEAPLPVDQAVAFAAMICDGIHHAHENGIIHRDIKPHNILITKRGSVKVADFGIAQAISKKTLTFGRDLVGTVHYISPEQAKGEPVTPATDIYSLGCVLYEMLTGKPPFDAESTITVALKHIHDDPVPPETINSLIPAHISAIIMKAMEKLPTHRFTSAEEMRDALLNMSPNAAALGRKNPKENTIVMGAIQTDSQKTASRKRRLRPTGIALILTVILGLFSGLWFVLGSSLFGQEVVVPDIQGMPLKDATEQLTSVGLKLAISGRNFSAEVEKESIISQQPEASKKVKKGREIQVVVSKGPELTQLPVVIGLPQNDAEIQLRNAGFVIGMVDQGYDDRYGTGVVVSQKPNGGTEAPKGSKIDLLISKGKAPAKVAMPKLVGLTLDQAKQKLVDSGLVAGDISRKASNDYISETVIEQDTAQGVMVDAGSSVKMVVSNGPGPVARITSIQFTLPSAQKTYRVVITVKDSKGTRTVYNQTLQGGVTVPPIAISYYGSGTAEVTLNGAKFNTYTLGS